WQARYPNANIGTPSSWCVVLDVDRRHGGEDTLAELERQYGALPDPAQVLTGGGGRHIYFARPAPPIRTSAAKIGPGLDIPGDGGYLLLPPATHVSGGVYADDPNHPLFETPLAPMPAWLVALASAPTTSNNGGGAHRTPDAWVERLIGAPEGQRRAVALEIAGHYLGR